MSQLHHINSVAPRAELMLHGGLLSGPKVLQPARVNAKTSFVPSSSSDLPSSGATRLCRVVSQLLRKIQKVCRMLSAKAERRGACDVRAKKKSC